MPVLICALACLPACWLSGYADQSTAQHKEERPLWEIHETPNQHFAKAAWLTPELIRSAASGKAVPCGQSFIEQIPSPVQVQPKSSHSRVTSRSCLPCPALPCPALSSLCFSNLASSDREYVRTYTGNYAGWLAHIASIRTVIVGPPGKRWIGFRHRQQILQSNYSYS